MPAKEWLHSIGDKETQQKIYKIIYRAGDGNFGNFRNLGDGVFELKINFGPGFRVYFGIYRDEMILILIVGDKSSQGKDILKAKEYWSVWKKDRL